jgi:chemotaxis protein CheX
MSAGIDTSVLDETVFAIAEEVFSAMIDGEPGLLARWFSEAPELTEPTYAWVDMLGAQPGRVLVNADRSTATEIARGLLCMAPDEPVEDADLVDAFGEIANVVGGNVKSLVPEPGPLTLPQVSDTAPGGGARFLYEIKLSWRGLPVAISLWVLP